MFEKLTRSVAIGCDTYDVEWLTLIIEAKQSGLTIDEVRKFLLKRESYTSMKSSFLKANLSIINSKTVI